jgi:signal transduction histidine kinase
MTGLRLLLVEDDDAHARLLQERLRGDREIAAVTWSASLDDAIARVIELWPGELDAALLDLGLPDSEGIATVRDFHAAAPRLPIVVLSGQRDMAIAIEAMRHGAQDYLVKTGGDASALIARSLRLAIERKRMQDVEQMLVGVVSHDLRVPLQTIVMACEMVIAEREAPPPAVVHARRAALRATSLVNDLLDATRARLAGVLALDRSDTDIAAVIHQVVDEVRLVHPRRRIAVDCEGPVEMSADARRIAQVMQNLLGNAIQHSPAQSDVRVALRRGAGRIELTVHNLGTPIPRDLQARLFEPLERASYLRSHDHGIGLGLFIVHEIVRAHGGVIGVDSSPELGTTFRVVLPLAPPSEDPGEDRRAGPGAIG